MAFVILFVLVFGNVVMEVYRIYGPNFQYDLNPATLYNNYMDVSLASDIAQLFRGAIGSFIDTLKFIKGITDIWYVIVEAPMNWLKDIVYDMFGWLWRIFS